DLKSKAAHGPGRFASRAFCRPVRRRARTLTSAEKSGPKRPRLRPPLARHARNRASGEKIMRVYYDRDADLARLLDKKIAIVGYGSQGRAHALNLKDSCVANIVVALRPGSETAKKVEADGLPVKSVAEASAWA